MKLPHTQAYDVLAAPEIEKLDDLEKDVQFTIRNAVELKLTTAQLVSCYAEIRKIVYLRSMLKGLIEPEGDRD